MKKFIYLTFEMDSIEIFLEELNNKKESIL